MKKILALLLVVTTLFSLAACGSKSATPTTGQESSETTSTASSSETTSTASSETIKIGLVTAVTGSNSLVGEESTEGATLAVKEINAAGGINGQMLELIITDEVDNLEMSVLATQELLANDEIVGIIGSLYSQYCIAALPAVLDAGVPFFCSGSSSGVSKEENPYTWQVRPLDTAQGQVLADYVVNELGSKKPAIMYSTQSTFLSLQEQTVKAMKDLGIDISEANLFAFPEDESNYAPYISQIQAGDYDCLIAMANQAPSAVICQQVEAAGLTTDDMPLVGSTSFCSSVCITNAGSAADGWLSVSDWAPGGSNPTAAAFEKNYLADNPHRPVSDLAAVAIYDAVYVLAEAMKLAGTTTDREAINNAMQKIDFEGAISHFKYNEDHSFATALSVTQNIDGVPTAIKAVSYR